MRIKLYIYSILLNLCLILSPHCICHIITPSICSCPLHCSCLSHCQLSCYSQLQILCFLKTGQFFRVMGTNKIVDGSKGCREVCLVIHINFRWVYKDAEASFEDTKYTLNDVASRCVTEVKKLISICWPANQMSVYMV